MPSAFPEPEGPFPLAPDEVIALPRPASGRGFVGITYNSKANPILFANWIWAIGLWDFGRAGPRTVRIGAYRCV